METTASNLSAQVTEPNPIAGSVRIFSTGSLGLGGFFGGPLAILYLICRDLVALGCTDLLSKTFVWFVPFLLFWSYCLFSFPPDFLSQFILYLPQTILWWIVARHLFGKLHLEFASNGGVFRSKWQAIRFGFFTFLGLKVVFFLAGMVWELWAK